MAGRACVGRCGRARGSSSELPRVCSSASMVLSIRRRPPVSALGVGRSSLVLELGLHHSAVTVAVESGAQARRRRVLVSEQGGLHRAVRGVAHVHQHGDGEGRRASIRFQQRGYGAAAVRCVADVDASGCEERGETTAAVSNGDNKFEVSLVATSSLKRHSPSTGELVRLLHAVATGRRRCFRS